MKAIVVTDEAAGLAGMSVAERPEPRAAINDVIVEVHASGFVPTEIEWPSTWTDRRGLDRAPSILGHELAGLVTALGYGTTGLSVGQRVFGLTDWHRDGTLAQFAAVEARNLAPLPGDVDFTVGASLPISGLTAWQALFETAQLQEGETIFIPGGAGGVGHLAIQLARWRGARVITATSTRNLAFVQKLGADLAIDYTCQRLEEIEAAFDVVLDMMSEDLLTQACQKLKQGGRVVSLLRAHQALGEQLVARQQASYTFLLVHPAAEQLTILADLCAQGRLHIVIEDVFPLSEVAQAHQRSQNGHVRGKLVLSPG